MQSIAIDYKQSILYFFVSEPRYCSHFDMGLRELVVLVRYDKGLLFVKFVGTHAQYDKINVLTV